MHHTLQQGRMPVVSNTDCTKLNTKNLGIRVCLSSSISLINSYFYTYAKFKNTCFQCVSGTQFLFEKQLSRNVFVILLRNYLLFFHEV